MDKITDINSQKPHFADEVVCVSCLKRWISVYPEGCPLKDLECPDCGVGHVILTGQRDINSEDGPRIRSEICKVIDLKADTLRYFRDVDDKITGVGDGPVEFVNVDFNEFVQVCCERIEKDKFKGLCIAWLLLNYPDVIKTDI